MYINNMYISMYIYTCIYNIWPFKGYQSFPAKWQNVGLQLMVPPVSQGSRLEVG